jgi:prepilin-type N-terminal cleavage/methylation domain-containing protein
MRSIKGSNASQHAGAGLPLPGSRRGFSLVELLMVIGIIALLVSIIIPSINKARESAIRVQCASNLRQVGLAERLYAHDNQGWLLLRDSDHPGTVAALAAPFKGLYSVPLAKYGSPSIWFCPTYRTWQTGAGMSDIQKSQSLKANRIGYAVFGAAWDGSKTHSTNPYWGVDTFINGNARKLKHLRPNYLRMSEWFASNGSHFYNDPLAFHQRNRWSRTTPSVGRPEGGNILMGDGSVTWSPGMLRYYGGEVYAVPENRNTWK